MVIIGAKGFAKEVLEVCLENWKLSDLAFYDDVNNITNEFLYYKFPVLKNVEQVRNHFAQYGNSFTIGIGNLFLRKKVYDKFIGIGGEFVSTISHHARISQYGIFFWEGCNIFAGSILSNSVILGKRCLIYYNAMRTHDSVLGGFVEVSPGATVLGRVKIGDFCQLEANATILPRVTIGKNVIIGAGAVVSKDLPDNWVAVGIPAKIIKHI
jgi:sugar O-acyltransferase (sialic acid O-acetyltransferase NeuD family)